MLLLIAVGIYAVVRQRISISRRLSLRGKAARSYGLSLIALAVPLAIIVNFVIRPILPAAILTNLLFLSIFNTACLAVIGLGLALPFLASQKASEASRPPNLEAPGNPIEPS